MLIPLVNVDSFNDTIIVGEDEDVWLLDLFLESVALLQSTSVVLGLFDIYNTFFQLITIKE